MLPAEYHLRLLQSADYDAIIDICRTVYPTEVPYTREELAEHHAVYPQGQFVAVHTEQQSVAGVHFTLRLRLRDFHIDDSWDVLTAGGSFSDHNPNGHTLYGADIMVDPQHQHHGLAHALTDATRQLVVEEQLWRMVGASRLPGYGRHMAAMSPEAYVAAVLKRELVDPVLTAHIKDGWHVVRPIHGYLAHDEDSAGWAAVIQWVNPECPPPKELDLGEFAAT